MVKLIFSFLLMALSFGSFSQSRKVGLLDLSARNAETNFSRIRSCRHILQTAGVPFVETTNLTQALQNPVVMFSPVVFSTTFTSAERLQIQQYVTNGGVIIASSVRDPALYPLFGVTGYTNYTDLKRMTWNVNQAPQYFDRFDDGFEKVISLSDTTGPQTVNTFILRPYNTTGSAQVLARFDNNTNALIMNQTGAGRTFLFAVDLRDVIIRNLINSDLHAQRAYSNIFEPTTDTFIFFVMNVVREHIPHLVRSHPCPNCDGSVVMITHDVDSRTAMDTMQIFINYEEQNNLHGMYNITTRYFHDSWMTDFYNGSYDKVEYAIQHGQRIASHSVGHFPDYDDESRFPFTSLGNTPVNYQPRYFNSMTTGGNVYGEVEVSKYLLENDHNVAVKSFRAGHLAFNQRLPKALQDCGYLYNSTFSANDVLTNFPFWDIDNMTFSGSQTNVLEIPMTISDASASNPFTEQNAMSIAQEWVSVTQKNYNNNAPTVLLIHPNRGYKLPAEQYFVSHLPSDVKYMFLDDFGDYWKKRMNMQFEATLNNDTLIVTWANYQMNQGLSFVIDDIASLNTVRFFDGNGNELFPQSVNASFGETRFCQFVYDESFEVCNGVDDDGDGFVDENLSFAQYADADQDGYGNPAALVNQCAVLAGYVTNALDCDDQSTVVHPNNAEYCDHLDNNCDGFIDEGFTWSNYYSDADGDGFGNTDVTVEACLSPDNFVLQPGDCDDAEAAINPNANEICNDLDDNCNQSVDEGLQFQTYYEDADQDGYGNDAVSVVKCVLPFGFVTLHGDCSDDAPAVNPASLEQCGDNIDNNCDGQIDEGCVIDNDEDGYDSSVDCDDENALINPGATEVCNLVDDDCDVEIDEYVTITYYSDFDMDGFGGVNITIEACQLPQGYVTNSLDCDDTMITYLDQDLDGNGSQTMDACGVDSNDDCDDNNASTYVGATEVCGNSVDENCDGLDEACVVLGCTDASACNYEVAATNDDGSCTYPTQLYLNCDESCVNDTDGDGVCDEIEVLGCTDASACNYDALATEDDQSCVLPSTEECNGFDDDCDGLIDENLTSMSINAALVNSALYPTCTIGNIYSANFNNAVPANALLNNEGVVIWYRFNAQYNAMRIGLSAALGDNEILLYESLGGCLNLIATEHEASSGNQILVTDEVNVGGEYFIAVRHLSGSINASAKICVNHFVASTCDHVYSNYTGIYSGVCSSFKAQYRGNATQYVFNVWEPQPWSYTTPTSSSIVTRLGSILPGNVSSQAKTYSLSVDVKYLISDVQGNYTSITALSNSTCSVTLSPEANIALRLADRCPVTKTLSQTIATDRSICGTSRYEWRLTRTLPTAAAPIQVLGGLNTTALFLSNVPGLVNGATYNVEVRAIHSSGIAGAWGAVQCLKIGGASGMVLESAEQAAEVPSISAEWLLYPNPSLDGQLTLVSSNQEEQVHRIQLFDALGREVWQGQKTFAGSITLNFPELTHGIYTLGLDDTRLRCVIGTE